MCVLSSSSPMPVKSGHRDYWDCHGFPGHKKQGGASGGAEGLIFFLLFLKSHKNLNEVRYKGKGGQG